MTTQSWTIGSRADCQLVVDHPSVSGEHCRLTVEDCTLLLEDLNSTNGTYVNGEVIEAPREVNLTDRITLGKTQLMPWPAELTPVEKVSEKTIEDTSDTDALAGPDARTSPTRTVITIGRGPQNSVVLDETNISTQHARLTVTPDQIILEDLGSTNGTSVGTVENKINRAEIQQGDTVFFGSTAYSVNDLIQRHKGLQREAASRAAGAPPTAKSATHLPQWIAGGIAAAAMLFIGWIIFGHGAADVPAETTSVNRPTTTGNGESATADAGSESGRVNHSPAELPTDDRLARSLFIVVAADKEGKTPFRVGTGFAVDARHVATTGAVISALHNLQENGFPDAFLYCPATGQKLGMVNTNIHSAYQAADTVAKSAQSQYDSIVNKYDQEPPPPDKLESVKADLLSAQDKAFMAFEEKTTYDVAVIETSRPLEHWLAGAAPGTNLRPNLKLNVRGFAHDVEDPFFDPETIGDPDAMASRVQQVVRISDKTPPRLLAAADPHQREYAWYGSPVLNAQGKVVAIYSRPTPPVSAEENATLPNTFDAPLFDRVRECCTIQP